MSFDLVIRNGTLVDGSGGPSYRADIGVRDGRIAAIGRVPAGPGRSIDAEGLTVTPGFIDAHTHMDAQVAWDPLGTSSCWHGVTSAIIGNCGFTLAPCRDNWKERLIRALETVEAIPSEAMLAGIDWRWGSYRDYLTNLERLPKGINYGGYIGHSALRPYAMGERAFTEKASDEEIARMRSEVADALKAGALGFSTSRGKQHVTPEGTPIPSLIGSWEEVLSLVGVLEEMNVGVFQFGRDRSDNGFRQVRDLALSARVPMSYDTIPLEEDFRPWLNLTEEAAAHGGRILAQAQTRPISSLWGFPNQLPWDRNPVWKDLRAKPLAEQLSALRDPALRERLVRAAYEPPESNTLMRTEAKIRSAADYEKILVMRSPTGVNPTIAQVARERGIDPVAAVIDLSMERDLRQMFMHPVTPNDEQGMLDIVRHPRTAMTFSDSGAHVSQICDFSLQTHMLAYWVRERQAVSLERAVRKMTYDIATFWGLHDRGLLREGMAADIVVFDPARVAPGLPDVAHDLPTGAPRLTQKAIGIAWTVVNGRVLTEDGRHSGDFPGAVLRNRLARESR